MTDRIVEELPSEALMQKSIVDLRARLVVLTQIIREAQRDGDERWRDVVPQQRRVNAALVAKLKQRRIDRDEPEPTPVVVGMKPAKIAAVRVSVGG
jgi:hypothetical protein